MLCHKMGDSKPSTSQAAGQTQGWHTVLQDGRQQTKYIPSGWPNIMSVSHKGGILCHKMGGSKPSTSRATAHEHQRTHSTGPGQHRQRLKQSSTHRVSATTGTCCATEWQKAANSREPMAQYQAGTYAFPSSHQHSPTSQSSTTQLTVALLGAIMPPAP
jgi:hypothetical protein